MGPVTRPAQLRGVAVLIWAALVGAAGAGPGAAAQNETAAQDPVEWVEMTGIAKGDHWVYSLRGEESGEVRNDVEAREEYAGYYQVPYDSFRVHASGEVTSESGLSPVPTEIDGDKWVRASDYANMELIGTAQVQDAETRDLFEAFNPPLVEVVFPFAEGYEWNARAKWTYERANAGGAASTGGEGTVDLRAKVEGKEVVTVPAGTFDAWKISYTRSYRDSVGSHVDRFIRWHVPEVCDLVREQRISADGTVASTMELTSFQCAAAEVDQPSYDTGNVTLLSRGVARGTVGPEAPSPVDGEGPTGPTPGLGDGPDAASRTSSRWLWPAIAVAALISVALLWLGRSRL